MGMAFVLRCTANNRYEILDDKRALVAVAIGRRSAEMVVTALNRCYGPGDPLELDIGDYDDVA
jgi:hypothetical protein